jgi:phytoene synthase
VDLDPVEQGRMSAAAAWDDPRVVRAVDACRRITRQRAANFYWGLRLTPEPKRSAMYAIYAWMRRADDIVDGAADTVSMDDLRAQVEDFRAATRRALAGDDSDAASSADGDLAATWIALAATARAFPLEASEFEAMVDGQIEDSVPRTMSTRGELDQWCWKVASTVGIICVRVWGHRPGPAIERAAERGIAFQLTNVIRDFTEDLARSRVYLPREDFDSAGLTPQALASWSDPPRCRSFVLAQCERARALYRSSEPLDALVNPDCAPVLRALTEIYRQLLERIAADPEAIVRRRVSLPIWRKIAIGLAARSAAAAGSAR